MKGEAEARIDAVPDRVAISTVIPLGNKDLRSFWQSPETPRERSSAAAVSLISSVANVHDISEAVKAL
jgi:hypothetical protein